MNSTDAAEHARNILADWDSGPRKTWASLPESLKYAWAGALAGALRDLLAAYDEATPTAWQQLREFVAALARSEQLTGEDYERNGEELDAAAHLAAAEGYSDVLAAMDHLTGGAS